MQVGFSLLISAWYGSVFPLVLVGQRSARYGRARPRSKKFRDCFDPGVEDKIRARRGERHSPCAPRLQGVRRSRLGSKQRLPTRSLMTLLSFGTITLAWPAGLRAV